MISLCTFKSGRLYSRRIRWRQGAFSFSRFIRNSSTIPKLPVFEAIASHDPKSIAVIHSASRRKFTYGELLQDIAIAKGRLEVSANQGTSEGQRIAFLVENSYDYVVTLLSILASKCIAVPLATSHPAKELRHILNDSQASLLLSSSRYQSNTLEILKEGLNEKPAVGLIEKRFSNSVESPAKIVSLSDRVTDGGGLMLYTSGTTSRPKGVLLPQSALTAQSLSLVKAWKYSRNDHLLHVLPLHHIHGTVNALLAPLFSGSTIEFLFPFNASAVWDRFASPFLTENSREDGKREIITFFTAVPTIYSRLISTHSELPSQIHDAAKRAISPDNLRLNISGSAALPTPTKSAWSELSGGNVLLERYGMTEVGMAISCGLNFKDRVDGSVGWPLPSVEVRLVDTETNQIILPGQELDRTGTEREGEIQLRGPTVFEEYWRNPEATAKEFVDGEDGKGKWFRTGDVAMRKHVPGSGQSDQDWAKGPMYFIRGRKSVDIIKSGGEKISALEIERELLALPQISEAAVVGLPSETWGQRVAAVIVLNPDYAQIGKKWGPMDMRRALKDKLAAYKIPHVLKVIEDGLPRNAMGKVNKAALVKEIFPDELAD